MIYRNIKYLVWRTKGKYMLLTKTVNIRIIGMTREYYSQKMGIELHTDDVVEVPVEFLNNKSEKLVDVVCDYCGKKYTTKWYAYLNGRKNFPKDSCPNCRSEKTRDVCMLKYGVDNPTKAESVKQKYKETCLKKYGVDNPMKAEQTKEKAKQTNIEKYGTTCALLNKEIKEKSKKTLLEKYGAETFMGSEKGQKIVRATMQEKYGVDKPFQNKDIKAKAVATITERYGEKGPLGNEEIREKIYHTNIEKYGCENPMRNEEVKNRVANTNLEKYGVKTPFLMDDFAERRSASCIERYGDRKIPISKVQRHLSELFKCELNAVIFGYYADLYFPDERIIIEYDGKGHDLSVVFGYMTREDFECKEETRQLTLINNGYKVGRIVNSKDRVVSDDEYINIKNIIFEELNNKDLFIYTIS